MPNTADIDFRKPADFIYWFLEKLCIIQLTAIIDNELTMNFNCYTRNIKLLGSMKILMIENYFNFKIIYGNLLFLFGLLRSAGA